MSERSMPHERKKNITKEETEKCIIWMFQNSYFVKNNSLSKISNKIFKDLNIGISVKFIFDNKDKWILIDGKPYEKNKIPYHLLTDETLVTQKFKDLIVEL